MEAIRNGLGLDTIKVLRVELLEKLKSNKLNHVDEFIKSYKGFEEATVKELKDILSRAKKGDIQTHIIFDKPESHVDDYDTAIEMLEMSVDNELHITKEQFKCYVQDKWSWKNKFALTNMKYLGGN